MNFFVRFIFFVSLFVSFSHSSEDLQACKKTEVSKTSVIFTCMHGEYYVEYEGSSRKNVKELSVLFTKAQKYKYLENKNTKDKK